MSTKVIGFFCDSYARYSAADCGDEVKNIVPLEEMTPKQRYELALSDDDDAFIWDNIDSFLTDLNDESASVSNMWVYSYEV